MIGINRFIAWSLPALPKSWVGVVARHYIAGETLDAAVDTAFCLNRSGCGVTLDLLGEAPETRAECRRAVAVYEQALARIGADALDAGISIKPSQMGYHLDPAFCRENIRHLVERAARQGSFVRLDMEDSDFVDPTLEIFNALRAEKFENVGVVLQAYLRRAMADVESLGANRSNVRLCKGAYYWELRSRVYKDPAIINTSYTHLLEQLFLSGCFTGIATHDEKLVFEALRLIQTLDIPASQYEFQMLYGVEEELRQILVDQGHRVRVYVPFGKDWFAYSVRRLRENPRMVGYVFTHAGEILRSRRKS